MNVLSENERLNMILEAVKYCQKVRSLGMPATSYAKALREPVYFLWESYGKKKHQAAKYCSESSLVTPIKAFSHVYDHAIPFNMVLELLLNLDQPDIARVRAILEKYLLACWITRAEDKLLTSLGFRSNMPVDADETDFRARYASAGIPIMLNPAYIA